MICSGEEEVDGRATQMKTFGRSSSGRGNSRSITKKSKSVCAARGSGVSDTRRTFRKSKSKATSILYMDTSETSMVRLTGDQQPTRRRDLDVLLHLGLNQNGNGNHRGSKAKNREMAWDGDVFRLGWMAGFCFLFPFFLSKFDTLP